MSNAHRGLPPPLGLSLPNPERHIASSTLQSNNTNLDQITQPSQWQSSDASAQAWLQAKVEEERRRQEEERTRQEGLRLEQRKIEQSMLRESLQGGVPPHLVPIVFAGLGSTVLTNVGLEWTQQHIAQGTRQANQLPQFQEETQSRMQPGPILPDKSQGQQRQVDAPRPMPPIFYPGRPLDHGANDTQPRTNPQIGSTFVSGTPNALHNSLSLPSVGQTVQTPKVIERNENSFFRGDRTPVVQSFSNASGSGHAQRQTTLSHLNSGEMRTHPPPRAGHSMSSQQLALQQQQNSIGTDGNAGSPSIYFHHWIPPGAKDSNNNRQQQSQQDSPKGPISTTSPGLRADYESSPKKRKTVTTENDIQQPSSTNIHQPPRRTFSSSRESRWTQQTEHDSRSSSRSPRRQSRQADPEARRDVLLPQG